jgi:hypothetical protein
LRTFAFVVLGFLMIAATPSSHAASAGVLRTEIGPSPNVVEVDRRCGRGRHWVSGHRNRFGHWVRGHCGRYRR